MPLTTIDPAAALLTIDLQKGILRAPTAHPVAGVIDNAGALAAAFRRHDLPVVLVTVAGGAPGRTDASAGAVRSTPPPTTRPADFAEIVDELDAQAGDHRITKQRWGAFTGTSLDEHLRERGVTQVFLTGVATSIGVESTARFAHELGYHVVLVTDAMTDTSPDAHDNSVERVFPRLGETATTAEVLEMLRTC
ncbi:isochorismatase family cysteine hydrolase [Micromonospora sp. NPDC002575]|uniref:isochorismatase family cysteine hydrolase n=1 Tax=Micromonospora sp. NPDC002575 TaxID=3364222 RepID=UPI00368BF07E